MNRDHIDVIHLLGWEVDLNGDAQCHNFIATQVTNAATFKHAHSGLELVFENKKLKEVFEYTDGERQPRALQPGELGLAYPDVEQNKILVLTPRANGPHQLGGEVPPGFLLPVANTVAPFQYLGHIDNSRDFNWLPFRVHLACPIYLTIENVFLDYTDPLKPTIINQHDVESAGTTYDHLDQQSEIVFNEMAFDFVEGYEFPGSGHAGIPNWIQYPAIPTCPKTGRRMKFLCQLNGGVSTKRTNVEAGDDWYQRYFEELNFWGDGDMFVFFEPTSKVACYFIQNT